MWLLWCVVTLATLMADPGHSEAGLSSTSFSNELRSGFTRLFQNGVEQPLQSPYILVNPTDFQNAANPLIQQLYQQRPAPFGPQLESTFHKARPRYELQSLSWVIPYYYVPTRYHPPRGGKRSNDVLVVVVKTRSNCTANNGTESSNPTNDDDDDDDDDSDEVRVIKYTSAIYCTFRWVVRPIFEISNFEWLTFPNFTKIYELFSSYTHDIYHILIIIFNWK